MELDNELQTLDGVEDGLQREEENEEEVEQPIEDVTIPIYGDNGEIMENVRYGDLTNILKKAKQLDNVMPYVNTGAQLQDNKLAQDILYYQSLRKPGTSERQYTDAEIIRGLSELNAQQNKTEFDSVEEEIEYKQNQKIKPLQDEIQGLKQFINEYVGGSKDEKDREQLKSYNGKIMNDAFKELNIGSDVLNSLTESDLDNVLKAYYPHLIDKDIFANPQMRKIQYMTKSQAKDIVKKMIENKTTNSKIKTATKGGNAPQVSGATSIKPSDQPEQKYDRSRGVPQDILDQELRKYGI